MTINEDLNSAQIKTLRDYLIFDNISPFLVVSTYLILQFSGTVDIRMEKFIFAEYFPLILIIFILNCLFDILYVLFRKVESYRLLHYLYIFPIILINSIFWPFFYKLSIFGVFLFPAYIVIFVLNIMCTIFPINRFLDNLENIKKIGKELSTKQTKV